MDKIKVLLVDDLEENLLALESLLRHPSIEFMRARSGVAALELLLVHDFALAMLDVQMPEMDGFELAEMMRGTVQTRTVPIIFVTAGARDRIATFKGYDKGAVDFLYKPLDSHIVKSKVNVFIELAHQKHLLQKQLMETQVLLKERDEALQTRDEFLSIASHELKTPLTSLHLQLQLVARILERDDITPETKLQKINRGFSVCERQSGKLASLLDELLDLTRIRLGRLQLETAPVELNSLTRDIVERFRHDANQAGVEIHFDGVGEVRGIWDPNRVDQIISNLLSNAIKYGAGQPAFIRINRTPDGRRARFEIQDRGIGIPPDMIGKIFERFERAVKGSAFAGLGLGLYITRQIVEAHQGKIEVESAPGQGTKFIVELPLEAPDADIKNVRPTKR